MVTVAPNPASTSVTELGGTNVPRDVLAWLQALAGNQLTARGQDVTAGIAGADNATSQANSLRAYLASIFGSQVQDTASQRSTGLGYAGLGQKETESQRAYALALADFNRQQVAAARAFELESARFGADTAQQNYQQRLGQANVELQRAAMALQQQEAGASARLNSLGLLSSLKGPESQLAYNYVLGALNAPEGQQADPYGIARLIEKQLPAVNTNVNMPYNPPPIVRAPDAAPPPPLSAFPPLPPPAVIAAPPPPAGGGATTGGGGVVNSSGYVPPPLSSYGGYGGGQGSFAPPPPPRSSAAPGFQPPPVWGPNQGPPTYPGNPPPGPFGLPTTPFERGVPGSGAATLSPGGLQDYYQGSDPAEIARWKRILGLAKGGTASGAFIAGDQQPGQKGPNEELIVPPPGKTVVIPLNDLKDTLAGGGPSLGKPVLSTRPSLKRGGPLGSELPNPDIRRPMIPPRPFPNPLPRAFPPPLVTMPVQPMPAGAISAPFNYGGPESRALTWPSPPNRRNVIGNAEPAAIPQNASGDTVQGSMEPGPGRGRSRSSRDPYQYYPAFAGGGTFSVPGFNTQTYSPEQFANMPVLRALRGEVPAPSFQGYGKPLMFGGKELPWHLNLQQFRDFNPTQQKTVQGVYETPEALGGLGLNWQDVIQNAMNATPFGKTFGPASYRGR